MINEYGKYFLNVGDVVVWRGYNPCIGRIKYIYRASTPEMTQYAFGKKRYNSLSGGNLRPATAAEIEFLGENKRIPYRIPFGEVAPFRFLEIHWICQRLESQSELEHAESIRPYLKEIADIVGKIEELEVKP